MTGMVVVYLEAARIMAEGEGGGGKAKFRGARE